MTRAGPNASSAVSAYGRRPATVQEAWSASVTIPESLQYTLGSAASSRIQVAHGSSAPDAIGGLDRWSSTKVVSGTWRTTWIAAGSWAGRVSRS